MQERFIDNDQIVNEDTKKEVETMVERLVSNDQLVNDDRKKEDEPMQARELIKPEENNKLPAHMRSDQPVGLENVGKHQSRQRLKVVQPSSNVDLVDKFGKASIILTPEETLLAEKGEPILATTMAFWSSVCKSGDFNDPGKDGMYEEVFSPDHPYFARAQDRAKRSEQYGPSGEFTCRYDLTFNFPVLLRNGDLEGQLCQLSYNKGNAQVGRNLNAVIARRGRDGVSIFGNTFKLFIAPKSKGGNTWYAIEFELIPDWVETEEMYAKLAEMHTELMEGQNALLGSEPPAAPENNIPIEVEA